MTSEVMNHYTMWVLASFVVIYGGVLCGVLVPALGVWAALGGATRNRTAFVTLVIVTLAVALRVGAAALWLWLPYVSTAS